MGWFRQVLSFVGASIVVAVCSSAFVGVAPAAAEGGVLVDDPIGAARLLMLANESRAAAGLAPLELRYDVFEIADAHSERMADANDIFHNDAYFTAETRQRLGARSLGENVALNTSMDDAHARLMNSPGHRANLMSPKFTVVGMAVVRNVDGTGFITQNFVEPSGAAAQPAPAPEPEAAPPAEPEPAPQPEPPTPVEATPAPAPARAAPRPAPKARSVTKAPKADTVAVAVVEPGEAPTTTARESVSVVTEPISSSASPAPAAAGKAGTTSPLVLVAAAFAILVMVATAAARAVTVRRTQGGPTDSGV